MNLIQWLDLVAAQLRMSRTFISRNLSCTSHTAPNLPQDVILSHFSGGENLHVTKDIVEFYHGACLKRKDFVAIEVA